eukprot:gene8327-10228_t
MTTTTTLSLIKKLEVLRYPNIGSLNKNQNSVLDRDQFISVSIYLLERYLYSYLESSDIKDVILVSTSDHWESNIVKFLVNDLKLPSQFVNTSFNDLTDKNQRLKLLDLLSNQSIKSSYINNNDDIHETKYKYLQKYKLKKLEYNKDELNTAILKLANLFNINITPEQSDYSNILNMIVRIAERKFEDLPSLLKEKSKENIQSTTTTTTTTTDSLKFETLSNNTEIVDNDVFPLGFNLENDKMNAAATILRLLYVSDLRELQTKINQILAAVQSWTADPQTNFKLGLVGR